MSRIALPNLRIGGLRQFSFGDPVYDRANLYPNLDLDFATNKNLTDNKSGKTSLVSFSRSAASSPGTYVDSQGLIKKAAVNLMLYSEQFDDVYWTKSGTTLDANQTTAPDGKQTADKLRENTAIGFHRVYQLQAGSFTGTYTTSFYVKAAERSVVSIRAIDNNASNYTTYNLATGEITNSGKLPESANLTDVGSGWFRISRTDFLSSATARISYLELYNGGTQYLGDGTSGVFVWGGQLEETEPALMGPSAYIKTTSQSLCAPRFDHEPTSGNLTTNLLLYSEMLDNTSVWLGATATVSANQIASPFGDLVADKIIPTSGANLGFQGDVYQQIQKQAQAIQYTTSVYAKAAEFTRLKIQVQDSGANGSANVTIDLDDGSVVSAASSGGTFSGASSSVETLSDGWYRVSLTFTTGAESNVRIRIFANETGVSGDASSGIYVFGAQLEAASSASTYVRTLGETRSISDATAESLGLLVEEQRTNFVTNSEDLSGAFLTSGGTGVTPVRTLNYGIAPDGTQTAERFVFDRGGGTGIGDYSLARLASFSYTIGDFYYYTVYVKAVSGSQNVLMYAAGGSPGAAITTATVTDAEWTRIEVKGNVSTSGVGTLDLWFGTRGTYGGADDLDVLIWGLQAEEGVSFPTSYIPTNGSTQTRYADIAAIQDEDFSVTNLLSYSESFDVDWVPDNVVIQANAAQSPDGQTTADLVYPASTGGLAYVRQDGAATSTSTRLSLSVYAKASGKDKLFLYMVSSGTHGVAYFDLADQSTSVVGGGSSTPTATIEDVGSGWYRCTYIIGTSITMLPAYYSGFGPVDAKGSLSITANGTDGVLFWGAQLTATSYPVDYVSTRNLLTDSQDFERWATIQVGTGTLPSISSTSKQAPDGTNTAEEIVFSAPVSGDQSFIQTSATVEGSTQYVGSVYVKGEGANIGKTILFRHAASAGFTSIVLTENWQRIQTVETGLAGLRYFRIGLRPGINGTTPDTVTALLWGAQLEPGTTATEYYRTYDVVGKNYNWYEPTEGTAFADVSLYADVQNNVVGFDLDATNTIAFGHRTGALPSGTAVFWIRESGNTEILRSISNTFDNFKICAAWKPDNANFASNGTLALPDTNVTLPIPTQMTIGKYAASSQILNGHIKRLIYFPRRTKDSNLVLMTE